MSGEAQGRASSRASQQLGTQALISRRLVLKSPILDGGCHLSTFHNLHHSLCFQGVCGRRDKEGLITS